MSAFCAIAGAAAGAAVGAAGFAAGAFLSGANSTSARADDTALANTSNTYNIGDRFIDHLLARRGTDGSTLTHTVGAREWQSRDGQARPIRSRTSGVQTT
jgi:hypothetical protein